METHVFRRDKNGRRYFWPSLFHLDPVACGTVPVFISDVINAPSARDFYLGSVPQKYANAVLIGNHAVTSIRIGGRIVGEEMVTAPDDSMIVVLSIDDTSGDRSIMRCRLPFGLYQSRGLVWGNNYGVVVAVAGQLQIRNRQLLVQSMEVLDRRGHFTAELEHWHQTLQYRQLHLAVDWKLPLELLHGSYCNAESHYDVTTTKDLQIQQQVLEITARPSELLYLTDDDDDSCRIIARSEDSVYLSKSKKQPVITLESEGSITEIDRSIVNIISSDSDSDSDSDIEIVSINTLKPVHHVLLAEIIRVLIMTKFAPILVPQLHQMHLREKWGTLGEVVAACQELFSSYNLIVVSSRNKTITCGNLRKLYNNTANCLRRIKLAKMTFDENKILDVKQYVAEFPQFTVEKWDLRVMNSIIDCIVMYDVGDKERWVCGKYQWRFKG